VFRGPGRLAVEPWPRPVVGDGELLLALRGCGLCGSDIAKIVAADTALPAVFGHELVGTVVETGRGVEDLVPGDRVVAAHHVPCGDCHYCRRGSHSMCRAFKASNLDPGGFAEYVRVPAPNVRHATFRLPPHVTDETASFVEPLACCLRAVRRARVEAGDVVAVVGLGSIGCLFVQLARRAGATVVGVDPLPARRATAVTVGGEVGDAAEASARLRERSHGRGADLAILTGGGTAVVPWAVDVVRDGGAVHVFAGGPGEALPIPLDRLYHRELTVTATYSSSPADLQEAFKLLTTGQVTVDGLLTHQVPLARLAEGVALMQRREAIKVWVTP
jgi:L-iditol 2-dehydrogenase